MDKQKAIIIDLEGTLSDHSARLHHLENKDYDAYNAEFYADLINKKMVGILQSYGDDVKIILVTAKSEVYRQEVGDWLAFNGVDDMIDMIHYRSNLDSRSSVLVKQDILKYISEKFDIIAAYDDRQDICAMYENYDIPTHLVEIKTDPGSILKSAAKSFEDKNKEYGEAYLRHGHIMAEFFPNGICLKSPDDFLKFHLFELDVIKSNRLASSNFNHKDSWHDKMIYSAMAKGVLENE